MEKWKKELRNSVCSAEIPAAQFQLDPEQIRRVAHEFPFRIPAGYYRLIRKKDDPVYKQCIPSPEELNGSTDLMDDPLGEEKFSPVPNIVHHYPDRCLFLVSNQCAMYCRFCTRKRKFQAGRGIDPDNLEPGFDYIRSHAEIRDVLVSGGDPFLLDDDRIDYILKTLRAIPHLRIIRIGTRTPCVLPDRITVKLTRILKKYHPLYINVHFNHPDEVTPAAEKALTRLADAGIPLGSQTVLLKGVNDDPEVIRELMWRLLAARVHPYYIFQSDLVYGTSHFRTPVADGLKIMRTLQGNCSGMACPHFSIDLPGGGGKIRLTPDRLKKMEGSTMYFENWCGELRSYPDLDEEGGKMLTGALSCGGQSAARSQIKARREKKEAAD